MHFDFLYLDHKINSKIINTMKILHSTAEYFPYIKVGGLSDMLASLAKRQSKNHEVHIALPLLANADRSKINFTGETVDCVSKDAVYGSVASDCLLKSKFLVAKSENVTLYFFESPAFEHVYSIYANHDELFIFAVFSYACYHLGLHLDVDIVHSHDWHTSIVTVLNAASRVKKPTCFTIHNLTYQGDHPFWMTGFLRIDPFYINPEIFEHSYKVNYMKGALNLADEITTVSPGYRNETLSEPAGATLSWILNYRQGVYTGIMNGVDYDEWNPQKDTKISKHYDITNVEEGKRANKLDLYHSLGLYVDIERPLIGLIGRLTYQKGFRTFLNSFYWKGNLPFYYVVLGTGQEELEAELFNQSHHQNQRIYFYRGFNEVLARKIEAASDFFIMPSLFEPCGLNQMYSQIYGSIPIVSRVGGLRDSVNESDNLDYMTGFVFEPGIDHSLNFALERACGLYYDKYRFNKVRENVMKIDWSWENSYKEYMRVYQRAIDRKKE